MTRVLHALAFSIILAAAAAAAEPPAVAVIDFDYFDTSGEPRDQTAEHARRLGDFMSALRRDLAALGGYRVVSLTCDDAPCVIGRTPPGELFAAARKAGARFILYGGVHKMSTLVQWAKTQLVDVENNRLVDDRWMSFRGDDDESWRRAEGYLAKRLAATPLTGK